MRTTINIDDDLIAAAREYTGITEKTELVRMALKSLVALEAGRRLAALGGSDPDMKDIPRRRSEK
ncbi:MAG: type II toxin-antitoxin system VapB family antitoxin [Bryobacteraceae bacterium]